MRAGKLRHSVTLQRLSGAEDDVGDYDDLWVALAVRRCSIEPLNGREWFDSAGEQSEVTTRIRLRYDSELASLGADDRALSSDGVVYDIVSPPIIPRENKREIILMCKTSG